MHFENVRLGPPAVPLIAESTNSDMLRFMHVHVMWFPACFLTFPLSLSPLYYLLSTNILLPPPLSLIRHLTLDILDSYPWRLPLPPPDSPLPSESIFSLMSLAESTPASVHTYRDRLVHLRRLDFAFVHRHLPLDLPSAVVEAPLRFLCGNLLVNFKLLWDPVKELIKGRFDRYFAKK